MLEHSAGHQLRMIPSGHGENLSGIKETASRRTGETSLAPQATSLYHSSRHSKHTVSQPTG